MTGSACRKNKAKIPTGTMSALVVASASRTPGWSHLRRSLLRTEGAHGHAMDMRTELGMGRPAGPAPGRAHEPPSVSRKGSFEEGGGPIKSITSGPESLHFWPYASGAENEPSGGRELFSAQPPAAHCTGTLSTHPRLSGMPSRAFIGDVGVEFYSPVTKRARSVHSESAFE